MKYPRVQYALITLIFAWVMISTVGTFIPQKKVEFELPALKSEPAPSENPQNRASYETMMLVDPNTGEIPQNIKIKEQEFAAKLRQRQERRIQGVNAPQGQENTEVLNWAGIGPDNFGGRTRAVALDVTDENIILAGGVSGGVWRSEDGGASWTKTTTPDQLHSVTCIVQDTRPGMENNWYYGTGELLGNSARASGAPFRGDGIYKSSDGGRTWQILPSTATNDPARFNFPFNYVWDIVINPNSANDEIIAAIFGGIVKSDDGGATWRTVLGDDLLALGGATDLNDEDGIFYTDVHLTSDGTFYASLSSITSGQQLSTLAGIYRSNNGNSWQRIQELFSFANRRTELGTSAGNPDVLYALTDGAQNVSLRRFDDSQGSAIDLTANVPAFGGEFGDYNPQNSYNMFVAVHPDDEDIVYIGGTNLYRSTDGFRTSDNSEWIGGYSLDNDASIYANHHPDQHDVVFYPSNGNRMISVNDGGIFRTENNRAAEVQYFSLNNGYVTTQYYSVQVGRSEDDALVLGGTQDNGTIVTTTDETNSSVRALGGDGAIVATTRFGIYYYMSFQNARMFRVTLNEQNRINSFARIDPIGAGQTQNQGYLFVNPYVLDPNNQNRMYLAGGDFVWRNRNLSQIPSGSQIKTGFNWTKMIETHIPSGSISAIDASTEPANIVYYGTTNGRLFRIDDAHIDDFTDTNLNINPGVNLPTSNISSISVDPTAANNLMVTFSNYGVPSIFFSPDGGENFTDVSGNLEENPDGTGNGPSVRWAEIVPLQDGSYQYYVGTSTGLYSTTFLDGANTNWTQEGVNTIGNVVVPMVDYRRVDGQIAVATHGNGLYFSQIANVEPEPDRSSFAQLSVENAFPNPFNDLITIRFGLPESDFVIVRIYDMQGRLVTTASAGLAFEGENEVFWDGTNEIGQRSDDGIYLVRFTYRNQNASQRVILSRQ